MKMMELNMIFKNKLNIISFFIKYFKIHVLKNLQISKLSQDYDFSMFESPVEGIRIDLKIKNNFQIPKEKFANQKK